MKIVHFVLDGAVVGGVERYLAALLGGDGGGLEHRVVLTGDGPCAFAGRWPVTTLAWSAEAPGARPDAAALADAIAALGGACLFHYPPAKATLDAARRAGVAVALFCHDHRWWCASASRYHARTGAVCRIRAATGACALRYYPLRCGGLRPGAAVRGLARAAAGRGALASADAVLVASTFMAGEASLHGAAPPRTRVVPLPAPFSDQTPPAPSAAGAPTVLFASRLTPEKGVDLLLDAFRLMQSGARLELAGTGIAARRVAAEAAAHPRAADIRPLGHLDGRAMAEAYARAAAVVVPSRWPEPFGLAGIEALAAGRPVVTTGAGGSADWAREDLGVLAVPSGRASDLAAALDRVLADRSWAERARHAGAQWVRERHSLAAHVAALKTVLAPLTRQR